MRAAVAAAAALVASLALAGCGTGGLTAQGDAGNGKTLFQQKCGQCHVLADAGTQGRTGPNLDDAFAGMRSDDPEQHFDESTIREVVEDQIFFAVPPMPQNLVTGQDAADVATYVAQVAGVNGYTEASGGAAAPGSGADTAGRSLFESNCAGCHTLAAANATGQVGPSLDQTKPDEEAVRRKVISGGGGMPSFAGQLTDQEIDQIARFVAQAAGGAGAGGDTPTSSDTTATPPAAAGTTTRADGSGGGQSQGRKRGGGTSGNSGSG